VRVALVHDFLYTLRGAERVLDVLCEIFPEADLYALLYRPGTLNPRIEKRRIVASFIDRLPGAHRNHRWFLPLYPLAVAGFSLDRYDLVVSSSYCAAKAVRTRGRHICYCHTPMRYVWDMVDEYFGGARRAILEPLIRFLRAWDVRTAGRVDSFIANSTCVAERIRRIYGRDSEVIHPPADADFYTPGSMPREEWFLCASAFAPYKRVDLVMDAFRRSGRPLKVVGAGQDEKRIRSLAGGNVELLGWQSDEVLRDLYRRCRALVFAGEEDFGIVPVEAQLCGAPVVAYGKGGLLDSVLDGRTGLFFREQTVASINEMVARCNQIRFDPAECRRNGERFSRTRFRDRMEAVVREKAGL